MLFFRQHLGLLLLVKLSMAVRPAGLAYSARPPAGAPAKVVLADASPLAGMACASLPYPLTSHTVALLKGACRASTRAETLRLVSMVPLAGLGGDLGRQGAAARGKRRP